VKNSILFKGNLLRDVSAFALANIMSKLAALFFLPFIITKIPPEQFGIYDSFLVVFTVFSSVLSLGLDSGTANYLANHSKNAGLLKTFYSFTIYVFIANMLLLSLVLVLLFKYEVSLIKISSQKFYLLLWIFVFFQYFNYLTFNFLRWTGRANVSAVINSVISLLSYIFGALFISIYQENAFNLILGLILGNVLGFLIYSFFAFQYLTLRISKRYVPLLRKVIVQSLPFGPMSLTKTGSIAIERTIVSNFLSSELYGYYSILSRIGRMPLFLYNSFGSAVHPYLFKGFGSIETRELSKRIYNGLIISAVFIFALMCIYEAEILSIFRVSELPNELRGLLSVLFIGQFVLVLRSLFSNGFLISGRTIYQLLLLFVGLLGLLIFGDLIISKFNVSGFIIFFTYLGVFISAISIYWSEYLGKSGINKHILTLMFVLIILAHCLR